MLYGTRHVHMVNFMWAFCNMKCENWSLFYLASTISCFCESLACSYTFCNMMCWSYFTRVCGNCYPVKDLHRHGLVVLFMITTSCVMRMRSHNIMYCSWYCVHILFSVDYNSFLVYTKWHEMRNNLVHVF